MLSWADRLARVDASNLETFGEPVMLDDLIPARAIWSPFGESRNSQAQIPTAAMRRQPPAPGFLFPRATVERGAVVERASGERYAVTEILPRSDGYDWAVCRVVT